MDERVYSVQWKPRAETSQSAERNSVSDRNRFIVYTIVSFYTADGRINEMVFYESHSVEELIAVKRERNFQVLDFSPKAELMFSLETPAKGAPKHSLQIVRAFAQDIDLRDVSES